MTSDTAATPQVLLLTGQAGAGKSSFMRHLKTDLLTTWSAFLVQETGVNLWFPVYVDCSSMEEFKADAIAETLKNELSLTEEGIKILQTSDVSNIIRPNLLVIFDGCDTAVQKLLEEFSISELDSEKCNIPHIIGAEKFETVKIMITCREESLQGITRRESLFAPIQSGELLERPLSSQNLFLQRKIEPFSDEQITRYLIKCCFHGFLETFEKDEIQKDTNFNHLNKLPSSSWIAVKNFERMVDSHGLREIARTPFMLKVIAGVLPSIAAENPAEQDLSQAKTFMDYQLIERFIDRAIQLNAQT